MGNYLWKYLHNFFFFFILFFFFFSFPSLSSVVTACLFLPPLHPPITYFFFLPLFLNPKKLYLYLCTLCEFFFFLYIMSVTRTFIKWLFVTGRGHMVVQNELYWLVQAYDKACWLCYAIPTVTQNVTWIDLKGCNTADDSSALMLFSPV